MAFINTIRNNRWLLIVPLGIALFAFIVMDVTSNQNMRGASDFTLGEVNGDPIDFKEFSRTEDVLYSGSGADMYERRDFLWNYFVEKKIVEEEADALGLSVGRDELLELEFGQNLSPVIRQRFANPQTGQVDRAQLNNIKQGIQQNNLPERIVPFWSMQEREIIKERLQSKLSALVSKGIYTPSWMVESTGKMQNATASLAYVNVPFSEIDDTEINLTDEDYNEYLQMNKDEFDRDEETRVAAYTTIEVLPTSEDSAAIKQQVSNLMPNFKNATSDSLFALNNNGFYSSTYQTKKEVGANLPDTIFSMESNTLYGPVMKNGSYMVVKKLDEMIVPDSIEARHILIQANPQQNPGSLANARQTIDSLKNVIEQGQASFDSLAIKFGQDATASKGGDLGTFGNNRMVAPMNNLLFFKAEPNELYTVQTQFGIHLVEVTRQVFTTDSKGVKYALIQEPIVPSSETQDRVYDQAIDMINNNQSFEEFKSHIEEAENLELNYTKGLTVNDYKIDGIQDNQLSRNIVRWLYSNDNEGEISPDIFIYKHPQLRYNQKYIIAARDRIIPAGLPNAEDVKNQLKSDVMQYKKGQKLKEQLSSAQSLQSVANNYGTDVDTIPSVKFSQTSIPGIGSESKLIGAAFSTPLNQVSKPIIGKNGVYVINVYSRNEGMTPQNLVTMRRSITGKTANKARTEVVNSIRESSDIEDNRNDFY